MKNLVSAAVVAMCLTTGANATQFIQNGDFASNGGNGQFNYTTSATGWYVPDTGNGTYAFLFANGTADTTGANGQYGNLQLWGSNNGGLNSIGNPPSGAGYFVALDGDFQNAPLDQDVKGLVVGKTYDVHFDYAYSQQSGFTGDTDQYLTVSLGGQSFSTPQKTNPSEGFTGWYSQDFVFTATSKNETLSFMAYGSLPVPPFALVSGVTLTGPAAPELSTWIMMLAGFGGLGIAARLRRRRAVAA
jgi:hypothetical protein